MSTARTCDAGVPGAVKGVRDKRFVFAGASMLKRIILFAVLLLTLAPAVPAAAQDPEQRIQAARRRAEQTGIPVALLDGKVAEGRAKGVPADRIAAAVERRLESLTRARDAMRGGRATALSEGDLSVGADALEAGVSAEVLAQIAARAAADRRAVAIAVLTQLVQSGVASERALERVTAALARGPDALRSLPGEASAERGRGPPAGRGPAAEPGSRGRGRGQGQGGPPASVPGPKKEKPDRPGGNPGRP